MIQDSIFCLFHWRILKYSSFDLLIYTVISPADYLLGNLYMAPSTSRTAYPPNRIIVTHRFCSGTYFETVRTKLQGEQTAKLQYDWPETVHPFTLTRIFIVQRALLAPPIGIHQINHSSNSQMFAACEIQWIQCPPGHRKIWVFQFPTLNWFPSYIILPQLQTQTRQKLLAMKPFPRHFLHL